MLLGVYFAPGGGMGGSATPWPPNWSAEILPELGELNLWRLWVHSGFGGYYPDSTANTLLAFIKTARKRLWRFITALAVEAQTNIQG